ERDKCNTEERTMTGAASDRSHDEQALRWIAELRAGTDQTRAEFGRWVRRSPEHLRAYLRHVALATELRTVDYANIDLPSLIERAATARTVVTWPGPSRDDAPTSRSWAAATRSQQPIGRRIGWILAAAILLPSLILSST